MAVVAPIQAAQKTTNARFPRQYLEGICVGHDGELLGGDPTTEQLAMAIGCHVRDRRAMELHALVKAALEVRRRHDLREHPSVDRHELVVDEFDVGLLDAGSELVRRVGVRFAMRRQGVGHRASSRSQVIT